VYSIGEFSKITGLTVKTLRFYHEQGLLAPSLVDPQTGYRYYDAAKAETARTIARLRELEFPLADIAEMLAQHDDETDILEYLARHRQSIEASLRRRRQIAASLDQIIAHQTKARDAMRTATYEVQEKQLDEQLVAAIRMRGRYDQCGTGFARLGRKFGRHICGPPLLLHYDREYKEDDADFEVCMPIRKGQTSDDIEVRTLPGGPCVALVHRGPYDELGRSYERVLQYVREHGYSIQMPTREVYLKGPGMIFRGNPQRYLTEIRLLIAVD